MKLIRIVIFLFFILQALGFASNPVFAANPSLSRELSRDGKVRFFVYHLDQFAEVRYADQSGNWLDGVEDQLKPIFRSRGDDETFILDRRLIELADHLQDHFNADTVEVISAYRSPDFNRELKEAGKNVANESFHTKGLAMDVHLDETDETALRDYLLSLKLGGVGYYGNKLMVHMDFGPVRRWTDGGFKENTEIGVFNKASAIKVRTDRLYYRLQDVLKLSLKAGTVASVSDFFRSGILEKFYRGRWLEVPQAAAREDVAGNISRIRLDENLLVRAPVTGGAFGKFRFRFKHDGDWQNSNEFYVKRE